MYYLQSRYYDAVVGRFVNVDMADVLQNNWRILENNLFVYCENDPINEIDYTGGLIGQIVKNIIIGAIKGVVSQLVADLITYIFNVIFVNKDAKITFNKWEYLHSIAESIFDELIGIFENWETKIKIASLIGRTIYKIVNKRMTVSEWLILLVEFIAIVAQKSLAKSLTKDKKRQFEQLRKYRKKNSRNLYLKAKKTRINLCYKYKGVGIELTIDIAEYLINTFWQLLPA